MNRLEGPWSGGGGTRSRIVGSVSPARQTALGITFAVLSIPLVTLLIISLGRNWRYPNIFPQELAPWPWLRLFDPVSGIGEAAGVSVILAAAVTIMSVLIALPAGYALATVRGRKRALLFAIFLAPAAAPSFAVAFGLHVAWLRMGLDGGLIGVAIGQLVPAMPYAVLILASAFMRIDPAWEEQARTLGARSSIVATQVILPLIRPSIAVAAAAAFIVAWGEYVIVLLLGGGRVISLPLHVLGLALGGERTIAAALVVLYITPPLLALLTMNYLGAPARQVTPTIGRPADVDPPAGSQQ